VSRRAAVALAAILAALLGVGAVLVVRTRPSGPVSGPPPADGTSRPSSSPPAPPVPFPPTGKVFLGLQTNLGPYDFSAVDAFAAATRRRPSVLQFSQGWAADRFDAGLLDATADRNMLPIISWEPWDYTQRGRAGSSGEQPAYRLARIINGDYDDYIRSWATGIAAWGSPVVLRFAHEMNGFWYPWCEQSNDNRPGDYVKAWRHVHDLFAAAGADNVTWLWSPNVTYPGASSLKGLYPGDSYVDWIGLSGYYGTAGREAYISFDQIFRQTFSDLKTFTHKPVVITETAATDAAGQRVRWINQMFSQLPNHPEVIGVIWFETDKEIDWRIASAPSAAAAFAKGAANARYDTAWTPNGVPRT